MTWWEYIIIGSVGMLLLEAIFIIGLIHSIKRNPQKFVSMVGGAIIHNMHSLKR